MNFHCCRRCKFWKSVFATTSFHFFPRPSFTLPQSPRLRSPHPSLFLKINDGKRETFPLFTHNLSPPPLLWRFPPSHLFSFSSSSPPFFLSLPPLSPYKLLLYSSSCSHSLSPSPSPSRLGCFRLDRSRFHAFDLGSTRRGAKISSGVGK